MKEEIRKQQAALASLEKRIKTLNDTVERRQKRNKQAAERRARSKEEGPSSKRKS